ncbi:MAG: hypothetical protein V3T31_02615 [candidate division Zixibacteria bacterium]
MNEAADSIERVDTFPRTDRVDSSKSSERYKQRKFARELKEKMEEEEKKKKRKDSVILSSESDPDGQKVEKTAEETEKRPEDGRLDIKA